MGNSQRYVINVDNITISITPDYFIFSPIAFQSYPENMDTDPGLFCEIMECLLLVSFATHIGVEVTER